MKLLLNLLAASALAWLAAGSAHAQSSAPMDTIVSDSGVVSRAPAIGVKRWSRSRSSSTPTVDSATSPKGSTDFDAASVEADRARKAAKLAQAERERNSHIRPGSPDCRIKPVMSDAEIAACRGS
jgi:hypothetical protein